LIGRKEVVNVFVEGLKRVLDRYRPASAVRLIVVSDNAVVRRQVARRLGQTTGLAVVARPVDGDEASYYLREERPDVVVLDLEMAVDGGLIWLESLSPAQRSRCIVLSSLPADDPYVLVAKSLGAAGYVQRGEEESKLADVVQQVSELALQLGTPAPPLKSGAKPAARQLRPVPV
jgi:DNA-binding NarL/FixJ family response regulator